jgi:hypothetical protein
LAGSLIQGRIRCPEKTEVNDNPSQDIAYPETQSSKIIDLKQAGFLPL